MIAISYGIAYLTKKDPKDIKSDPDTFNAPEIKEGTKFSIIAGTCWQEAPVVGWFGDIYVEKLGVRLSDTDGQYVYINKYSYGALHILAQGFCDGVLQIKAGDMLIWPDSGNNKSLNADAAASAVINLPDLYGGIKEHNGQITESRGGIVGTIDFDYGLSTQTVNDYLASNLGNYISANRGLTAAILRRPYIGTASSLYTWKYLVKRTDHLTSGEDQWYPAKASIRTYEINPIHWLREIYTDTEWGLGMSTALFNNTNLEAAADTLYDEGFGLCIKWEGEQSLETHVIDILRYINAVVYEDHTTGLIEIKLIRDDYVAANLETFDETDIVKIESFTRGMIHKIPDVTYVKYWDMYNNIPITTVSHDMALVLNQNEALIPNDVDYTGVVDNKLAGGLAARDQHQLSSFAAAMTIKCKRTMSHLKPGDVFKLSYTPLGIVSMIVRVVTPHYGTLTDGMVTFECMEDIFGMKLSLYAAPPSTNWDGRVDDPVYEDEYLIAKVAMNGVDPTVTIAVIGTASNVGWGGVPFTEPGVLCSGTTNGDTISTNGTQYDPAEGDIREVTMDDGGAALSLGVKYIVAVNCENTEANSYIGWAYDYPEALSGYTNGERWESTDTGVTWTDKSGYPAYDFYFVAKAGGVTKDNYTFAEVNMYWTATKVKHEGQSFIATSDYTITSVVLKLSQWPGQDDPGIVTVSIREMSGRVIWASEDEENPLIFTVGGTDYEITPGTSYNDYIYWDPESPTVFLGTDDIGVATAEGHFLVCTNDGGVPTPE